MRPLTLIVTLEYYDVPQILTAADATGTRYLCTLYEQTADGYHYLGVQISEPRLYPYRPHGLTCLLATQDYQQSCRTIIPCNSLHRADCKLS
ncbi:MAG: hypothetical protein K6D55_09330 [Prevotella sp.]|nr:hypothetical protein [Prevotella sp.]